MTANPFRFLARVFARLRDIDLARTAGSLSFTTLLAIVPLVTVAFAFVARFPIFEDWLKALEQFLLRHLLPFSAAAEVRAHIVAFADQAAQLTGVSILVITVSAMLAVATVEREINTIWGIRRGRSLPKRIVVYAIGLTAGPVLLGASISLTTWLVVHSLAVVPIRKTLGAQIASTLPFLFATAGLTLLYKGVPARHVALGPALLAGALAAAAFEGAKQAFAWYLTSISNYQVVYGALAVLPIFLLWIYLCWTIILAGAAVCATLAEPGGRRARRGAAARVS
ncbi:MAG TPA: YihY family inner membrane protein [Casimicrobiaceae bacterium]